MFAHWVSNAKQKQLIFGIIPLLKLLN